MLGFGHKHRAAQQSRGLPDLFGKIKKKEIREVKDRHPFPLYLKSILSPLKKTSFPSASKIKVF